MCCETRNAGNTLFNNHYSISFQVSSVAASQASSQEKADLMMEYKLKYERLCGVFKQFQEQHTQLVNVFQKQASGMLIPLISSFLINNMVVWDFFLSFHIFIFL